MFLVLFPVRSKFYFSKIMYKRSAHFVSEIYEDLRKGRINNILSKADLIQGTQIMTVKRKKSYQGYGYFFLS